MSSTLIRPRRIRRFAAGALTTALAAGTLALVPTSAQAAQTGEVTGGTATWGLSTYLNSANMGRPNPLAASYVAPSTFDTTTRISAWGNGTGTVNNDGSASLAFDGTSVNFAPTGGAWLKLTDVEADLNASGNGSVSAVVSYGLAPGTYPSIVFDPAQAPQRGPERVTLMDLAGNTAADRTLTSTTAAWNGLDGAWSPDFTSFLAGAAADGPTPAIPGFIYGGQVSSATDRTALPISFAVNRTAAQLTSATITEQTPTSLKVAVTGAGYKAGGLGVYVSIGEAGNTNVTDDSQYLGTVWTAQPGGSASAVQPDGSFSTTLSLNADAIAQLDPTKDYAVSTMKAHGQAATDPSQSAETPINIDFKALGLKFASKLSATASASKVYGKTATVTATVPSVKGQAPTGKVTLTGVGSAQAKNLAGGKVAFTVPANLAAGKRTLTLSYAGDANFKASNTSKALTVSKDSVTISDKVTKKPTTKKAGKVKITVKAKSSSVKPTGKVTVYFKKKGQKTVKTSAGTLKNGTKTLSVKKLKKKGTWKIYVKYSAGPNHKSVSSKYVGTVKVTK